MRIRKLAKAHAGRSFPGYHVLVQVRYRVVVLHLPRLYKKSAGDAYKAHRENELFYFTSFRTVSLP